MHSRSLPFLCFPSSAGAHHLSLSSLGPDLESHCFWDSQKWSSKLIASFHKVPLHQVGSYELMYTILWSQMKYGKQILIREIQYHIFLQKKP